MPQKKNPDVAELIRGKTGRLYGNLTAALVVMKGLPLTYNSDMQEDKEPLFDSVDTLEAILARRAADARQLTWRVERMRAAAAAHYSTATDLADYLVRKGLPFRDAHEVVGKMVRHAMAHGKELGELTLDELQAFSPAHRRGRAQAPSPSRPRWARATSRAAPLPRPCAASSRRRGR